MTWRDWLDANGLFLDPSCPLPLDRPFTLAQADGWGVHKHHVGVLVRRGLLRRVTSGVLVASQCEDSVLIRAQALQLVMSPDAIVCDRTAAWLHGITILQRGAHLEVPPLDTCKVVDSRMVRDGVAGKRRFTLLRRDVEEVHGVRVTTALRTAADLGRRLWRYDAIAALDGALRVGVDRDHLLDELPRFRGQRGVVQLRALVPQADWRAESPGESALRLRWNEAGLPPSEPQFEICDAWGELIYKLDVPLPELRFAAEYDGEEFHSEQQDVEHDERRRADLAESYGWTVRGFTKNDVYNPRSTIDIELMQMFEQARRGFRRWRP